MNTILTIGRAAKLCRVSPRTVAKWFDSGALEGWRVPGTQGARRVDRGSLVRFLRAHGMPTTELEEQGLIKVLVVGASGPDLAAIRGHLTAEAGFLLREADCGFAAGARCAELQPDCLVVDMAIGRTEAALIARWIRGPGGQPGVFLIAIHAGMADAVAVFELGFAARFARPINGAGLAGCIKARVARPKSN